MAERVRTVSLVGVDLPAIAPEDLVVLKALSHDEESPRHWHDALGVLASADLDWDYLLERARFGPAGSSPSCTTRSPWTCPCPPRRSTSSALVSSAWS